ncbi:MAG: ribosome-associated translation inhibitor RaiA [Oscillatoriales cyanobacterium RM2_1_1]|nr:ribosome-associated translation inhibitor RaiA [Oscillatoriales cyanobacterium SM2_3_0]NJO44599.1 ribosome-associated translation inhibitor RaiA [Oscillatoriales cyanobacterium RM2_1_1]
MKITPEITYRHIQKTAEIETLVEEKIAKLEQFCDRTNSCRIAIEKAHDHPKSGSPYRVRIDMTVALGHELAVNRSPDQGTQYVPLDAVIRDAFEAARRQLVELVERQNDQVKTHPQQAMTFANL